MVTESRVVFVYIVMVIVTPTSRAEHLVEEVRTVCSETDACLNLKI